MVPTSTTEIEGRKENVGFWVVQTGRLLLLRYLVLHRGTGGRFAAPLSLKSSRPGSPPAEHDLSLELIESSRESEFREGMISILSKRELLGVGSGESA
jgi:hypothetical protein